ncbi:MAG: SMC-Scp complex subunit ScpB [Myxococcota bacterium]|nr:SMC-Scp complex subunit ScpB [Myxococcota bacterium]
MSRKSRGKNRKHPSKQPVAVPEEILAEGSGPAEDDADADVMLAAAGGEGAAVHVGLAIDEAAHVPEVGGGEPEQLVAAADDVGRRRRKRRKQAAGDDAVEAAAEPGDEAAPIAEPTDALATDGDERGEIVFDAADAPIVDDAVDVAAGESPAADGDDGEMLAAGAGEAVEGADERLDHGTDADDDADVDADDAALVASGEDGEVLEIEEDGVEPGATLPTSAASMEPGQLKHLVEALVFASDKPITVQRLRQLTRVSDTRRLEQALADLAADYAERGIVLQTVSGGYQFRTRTQFSAWVQQLIAGRPVRLSRAQLETLAIIAYRQPITRPEIDDIRGVDSSGTLKVLIDRSLIRILGKREEVGRPMLYGTTKEFLDFFSLGDLRELPTLREYSELTDESRQVMSDRLGIGMDGSDDPEGGSGSGSGGSGGDSGAGGSGGPVADFDPEGSPSEETGAGAAPGSLDEFLASYSASVPEADAVGDGVADAGAELDVDAEPAIVLPDVDDDDDGDVMGDAPALLDDDAMLAAPAGGGASDDASGMHDETVAGLDETVSISDETVLGPAAAAAVVDVVVARDEAAFVLDETVAVTDATVLAPDANDANDADADLDVDASADADAEPGADPAADPDGMSGLDSNTILDPTSMSTDAEPDGDAADEQDPDLQATDPADELAAPDVMMADAQPLDAAADESDPESVPESDPEPEPAHMVSGEAAVVVEEISTGGEVSESWIVASNEWPEGSGRIGDGRVNEESRATEVEVDPVLATHTAPDPRIEPVTE